MLDCHTCIFFLYGLIGNYYLYLLKLKRRVQVTVTQTAVLLLHSPFFLYSIAWYLSVQASLPERREGEGQESPGEGHRAQGPTHLLTLSAWPPHRPRHPAQWLHWEGSQSECDKDVFFEALVVLFTYIRFGLFGVFFFGFFLGFFLLLNNDYYFFLFRFWCNFL